mgnify:CR=1 FL=1
MNNQNLVSIVTVCDELLASGVWMSREREGQWFHSSEQVRLLGFTDLDLVLPGKYRNG